ncbi:MAG: hypothetical protein ABFR82_15765 [Nitrospirota bacterium]
MGKKPDEELLEFLKIGNRAVKKAQKHNWEKGLPNVYSKNKEIYFEYPDKTSKKKNDKKS